MDLDPENVRLVVQFPDGSAEAYGVDDKFLGDLSADRVPELQEALAHLGKTVISKWENYTVVGTEKSGNATWYEDTKKLQAENLAYKKLSNDSGNIFC